MCACLSVCLSVCLSFCLSVCSVSVCLSVCLEVAVTVPDVKCGRSAGASAAAQLIHERTPLLHQMLQTLLQAGRGREAEVLTHTIAFVGGLLPPALHQGISQWALDACEAPDAKARQQFYSLIRLDTTISALRNGQYYKTTTMQDDCPHYRCIHNIALTPKCSC